MIWYLVIQVIAGVWGLSVHNQIPYPSQQECEAAIAKAIVVNHSPTSSGDRGYVTLVFCRPGEKK